MVKEPWRLTEEEQREVERLREELGTRFCRRCDYCQPCSEGIPISAVMNASVLARDLPPAEFFSGTIEEAVEKAADCSQCGQCEERCPFHLPIREMMVEQTRWYEEQKKKYRTSLIS